MDPVNGAYSPINDAIYAGTVVQALYKQWYKLPMLTNRDGSPMLLRMYAHYGDKYENAEWDGRLNEIHLGDGDQELYPLTSLGVIAHEVSHGFTTQHSNLNYINQSGSMNESFSDMSGMAAEVFAVGKPSWQIGPEIMKADIALRYMDQPSKDCQAGDKAGSGCSIDRADQYDYLVNYGRTNLRLKGDRLQSYIVHLASGVYNHAFYYLANEPGWDVRKAFQAMINANSFYWTKTTTFKDGACGVLKAAKDLKYDVAGVKSAFNKVAIDTSAC
jgi:pseudolysin